MIYTKEIELKDKKITIETGRYAKQADGAVMVRCGDTMVLVTAVASDSALQGTDFFPLSVEYREKSAAAGKIPGGFFKREGKPSEKEVLSARLIDRPIRPLFPKLFRNEVQLVAFVYSFDGENEADVLGAIGASAALTISRIPLLEPIGEVRVGRIDGNFVINPTHQQISQSDMEITIAGTDSSIMMVEGEVSELKENELLDALKFAHEEIKKIVSVQNELKELCGKPKMEVPEESISEDLVNEVKNLAYDKYKQVVSTVLAKEERSAANKAINNEVIEALKETYPESESDIKKITHDIEKELMRQRILKDGIRLDGRTTTEIRPITVELGNLARTHGSALFTRGETQSLTSLTLGTEHDEQIIDGLQEEYTKKFLLHYNFPPFSVGEVGRMSGVGRREIGHGNLAERALKFIIPSEANFPYTIRLNSDILESNGSSSMATVCAGSLSLMDGGVPVKKAVAGIAMGLIKEQEQYSILSDILGNEDHLGDMDFKVAGTTDGITAIQMDIKIQGISFEIMEKALAQAKEGRNKILGIMNEAISEPRETISPYAPSLITITIQTDQIGMLIGPGGKTVQGLQKLYGVEINIEDTGTVNIASASSENARKCKEHIKLITATPEVGEVYEARVVKIMDFGAFVEFLPGKEGLLHISQIDLKKIDKVTDVLKEGDTLKVKLIKFENGKYSLSRKALLLEESTGKVS